MTKYTDEKILAGLTGILTRLRAIPRNSKELREAAIGSMEKLDKLEEENKNLNANKKYIF